jgi:hypothetical protein
MFLAKAQGLSRLPITAETRVGSQFSLCEICGERNGAGTGFLPKTYSFVVPFSFLLFYYFIIFCFFRFLLFPSIPPIFSSFFCFLSLSSHRLFSPFLYGHSFPSLFPVCVKIVAKELSLVQVFH